MSNASHLPPGRPTARTGPWEKHTARAADGRRLCAVSSGTGGDLVVLEAGLGAGALSWGPVMELLSPHARAVAYDRAGYGNSDPDARPRDLARLAEDLVVLCESVPYERLILLGHSWGGPVVRLAARRLLERAGASSGDGAEPGRALHGSPADVRRGALAGLVLVDPSDEHAELYFSRGMQVQAAVQGPMLSALARLGLLRPLMQQQLAALPEPYRTAAVEAVSTPAAAEAMRAENDHVVRGLRFLRLHPSTPATVPLTLLTGRRAGLLDRSVRDGLSAAHAASARAHPAGRIVPAHRSGHLIPSTEPELVAEQALALLR